MASACPGLLLRAPWGGLADHSVVTGRDPVRDARCRCAVAFQFIAERSAWRPRSIVPVVYFRFHRLPVRCLQVHRSHFFPDGSVGKGNLAGTCPSSSGFWRNPLGSPGSTFPPGSRMWCGRGEPWEVSSAAGSGFYNQGGAGHGLPDEDAGTPHAAACNKIPLIGEYASLGGEGGPAGRDVLIRGAALTAYDAVLHLTEDRGGRWKEPKDAGGQWLKYVPFGGEPTRITMASRSIFSMDPKPEQVPEWIHACLDAYREQVRQWGRNLATRPSGPGAEYNGLWRILLACAAGCAAMCGAPATPRGLWRTALTGRGTQARGTGSSAEYIRRSIDVNRGNAVPGTEWLWARVWPGLYPEMVQAVYRVHWRPAQARTFRRVSKALERMAFGSPREHGSEAAGALR